MAGLRRGGTDWALPPAGARVDVHRSPRGHPQHLSLDPSAAGTQRALPLPLPFPVTHQAHEEVAVDLAIVLLDLLLSLSLREVRCLPLHELVLKDGPARTLGAVHTAMPAPGRGEAWWRGTASGVAFGN